MSTGRPPGRPALPPALKMLHGTARGATGPTGTKPHAVPDAPDFGEAGHAAWQVYWNYGKTWLAETDRPMLQRLCHLIDDAVAIRATVESEGLTHQNPRTGRSAVHNLYNAWLGLLKQIASLEAAAGFTPADRARLRFAGPPADDPLEAWMRSNGS